MVWLLVGDGAHSFSSILAPDKDTGSSREKVRFLLQSMTINKGPDEKERSLSVFR